MTHAKVDFVSQKLKRKVAFNLIIPQEIKNPEILLLLHGRCDSQNGWMDFTNLIRYNQRHFIIMPAGDISFYHNRENGEQFEDFLLEVIEHVKNTFGLFNAKVSVAGNSMGGHGSLNLAIKYEDFFERVGLFSPALYLDDEYLKGYPDITLKNKLKATEYKISNSLKEKIYLYCGTNDYLFEKSKKFSTDYDIELHVDEYAHEWDAWDKQIKEFLKN